MLTLLRFDLKNTWFKIFLYCVIIAVFTAFAVYFQSDTFAKGFDDTNFYWITIFQVGSMGVCAAVCGICLIMTFISLAQWFSQNLLSDEGHFMNMLPISKLMLFSSKALTAVIWNIVLVGFMVICVFVFLSCGDLLTQINDILADLAGEGSATPHIGVLAGKSAVFLILYSVSVCILAYTAICVGQTVNIGRNLVILFGFIGIGLAELIVGAVLAYMLGVFKFGDLTSVSAMIDYCGALCVKLALVSLVNCVISYALGVHLLNTNINLD